MALSTSVLGVSQFLSAILYVSLFALVCSLYTVSGSHLVDHHDGALKAAYTEISSLKQQIVELKTELDHCMVSLCSCRKSSEGTNSSRMMQDPLPEPGTAPEVNLPPQDGATWFVAQGNCMLVDECLSSPNFPMPYNASDRCQIMITSSWTGFLFVEFFDISRDDDFFVDGSSFGDTFGVGQIEGPHGIVPEHHITWSATSWRSDAGWKVCRVDTMPPWKISSGSCQIDRLGCFLSPAVVARDALGECLAFSVYSCDVTIADGGGLSLDVVEYGGTGNGVFSINGATYVGATREDMMKAGMQGLVPFGEMRFETRGAVYYSCIEMKICPRVVNVSGPWGDEMWTCTSMGDPCHSPCSQQFSDMNDADGNNNLHDGHPRCEASVGMAHCGPCSCSQGEEQSYVRTRLFPHATEVALISCSPCASGKFRSETGNGAADTCSACGAGYSSLEGATACTACEVGRFSDETSSMCVPCQAGSFAGGTGQTMCNECTSGQHAVIEGQTACEACLVGSVLHGTDAGCIQCSPGTFASSSAMTACAPCDIGSFQRAPGQSECHLCSDVFNPGGSDAHLWTTMERGEDGAWQELSAASDMTSCGCAVGARADWGQCVECGEGIICRGMGVVEVLPGYFASRDNVGSVWRCHGTDWARCPGGLLGICAKNRLNTSVACEECEPYTRKTSEGPCELCGGPDVGLLVGAIILLLCVLWCVYWVIAHENGAKRRVVFTLMAITGSQFVTVFQMLGVLNALSVSWPEPFARVVDLGSLMNFKWEVLNIGCVVTTRPLYRYVATTFSFVALVLCMVVYHSIYTLLRRAQLAQLRPALFAAVGSVIMAVFISVCSATVQPLLCDLHPNGQSTMKAYRQVLCWSPDSRSDHQMMVVIGAVASLIPVLFLCVCVWVIVVLPKRLHKGDAVFLKTFGFLFFRFRPGAEGYLLVLLLRNAGLAAVPVIRNEAIQLSGFNMIMVVCVLICASVSPWSVHQANFLDIALYTGVLFFSFLAALQANRVDEVLVGNMLMFVFFATMCFFLCTGLWCLHLAHLQLKKPFQFFLCHHKQGAGAFCRLLKLRLQGHSQVQRDVFLDSDNLQDLSLLFGIVGDRTDTLVVLCSEDILIRPWCVGEMTTAMFNAVDTILVIFPAFQWPSRTFIEDYATNIEGVRSLAVYGISVEMVQETLWWLGSRPWVVLGNTMTLVGVDTVVEKLALRRKGKLEMVNVKQMESVAHGTDDAPASQWRKPPYVTHHMTEQVEARSLTPVPVVSIVDHTNSESVCAALLVKELLKKHFPLTAAGHVLGSEDSLPESTATLLVVCSNGCFQKPSFVRLLFQAEAWGIGAIPIIVDGGFRFPSDAMYDELRALSPHILQGTSRNADDVVTLIRNLFEEIGINVCPQDSQAILEVRARTIAHRLNLSREPRRPSRTSTLVAKGFLDAVDMIDIEVCDDDHQDESRIKL